MADRPEAEALETAIAWLKRNDGTPFEQRDCRDVVAWLHRLLMTELDEELAEDAARQDLLIAALVSRR